MNMMEREDTERYADLGGGGGNGTLRYVLRNAGASRL